MSLFTYIAIYFIIWWMSLFLVLPFSGKTQQEAGDIVPGTTKSAPAKPPFLRIALINTAISTLWLVLFFIATEIFGLRFQHIQDLFPKF